MKNINTKKIITFAVLIVTFTSSIFAGFSNNDVSAYGRNGNWSIFQSSDFNSNLNLVQLFGKSVKNNPEKDESSPHHVVKEYMEQYDKTYNQYSVVDSMTDGKTIGDPGNPEIPSDPQLQNPNLYADVTYFTDKDGSKRVSGWYNSTYGPFIDAEVGNDSSSQEKDSADFAKLLFPSGNSKVFVASDEPAYYLRDFKSIATLYGGKYPVLISESGNYKNLAANLKSLNAEHAVFLGGTGTNQGPATFDAFTGIGTTGTDMVRIGGTNASQTARFVKQLPSEVYNSPEQPENNLSEYYSMTADSSISSSLVNSISTKLKNNDFEGAVKIALSSKIGDSTPRNETNVQTGIPALTIGGFDQDNPPTGNSEEDKLKEKYLKIYLCNPSTGQIVYQYFEAGFKFPPVNPDKKYKLIVKYSDGGTAGDSCELKAGETKQLWEKADENNGYAFTGWTSSPSASIDANNVITMPNHDTVVTANFSRAIGMVNLTVKASPRDAGTVTGGGIRNLVDGKAVFNNVTQTPSSKAPAQSHWEFDHWGVLYGDNVKPDAAGKVTITKDTCLIAYYKLVLDAKDTIYPDESSTLTSTATVDAAWYTEGESHTASGTEGYEGTTIAKEGQLVNFTVNTSSDDHRYPITDSRGWQSSHTPSSVSYSKDGFTGTLYGQGEEAYDFGYWHHSKDDDYWVSRWKYRQDYKGTIYRKPVQYFSATELRFYFPDGLVNTSPVDRAGLNSAIKDDLNLDLTTPYMLHYITSTPTYSSGFEDGQIWKNNTEKVEFFVPMTTPITIRKLPDGGTLRVHPPYKIRIEVREPSGIINNCYVNLDIKGNIYEDIYTTPVG